MKKGYGFTNRFIKIIQDRISSALYRSMLTTSGEKYFAPTAYALLLTLIGNKGEVSLTVGKNRLKLGVKVK